MGPAAHDGGLLLSLDTDGFGFNPPMLETMTRIFVEELEPLAIPVELCAASWVTDEIPPAWRSTADRLDAWHHSPLMPPRVHRAGPRVAREHESITA